MINSSDQISQSIVMPGTEELPFILFGIYYGLLFINASDEGFFISEKV